VLAEYARDRRSAAVDDIIPRAERHYLDSEEKLQAARTARQETLRKTSADRAAAQRWLMEHALFNSIPRTGRIAQFRN
jgi:hypothetical protein